MTLAVKDLSFGYDRKTIGEEFSFALEQGERLAILGPNGSGKTTLLKTLLGLLKVLNGTIEIDGKPIHSISSHQRSRLIAYVPQIHNGAFPFTVKEMILMGRVAHVGLLTSPSQKDFEIVDQAMETLEITHLGHKSFNQISGGERQMTLVARALAQQSEYIILDEPTASLDFSNQSRVMKLIDSLSQMGKGLIFTTHDPHHAYYHADSALLIRAGQQLAIGQSRAILNVDDLEKLYGVPVKILRDNHLTGFVVASDG